jgi:hypothetical protein
MAPMAAAKAVARRSANDGEHPGDLHLDGRIEKSIGEPGR